MVHANTKYTLQFWAFTNIYLGNVFTGFEIGWTGQNKIKIAYDGTNFRMYCYPFYDASNSSYELATSASVIITDINKWVFLNCAVDFDNLEYKLSTDTVIDTQFTYLAGVTKPAKTPGGATTLTLADLNTTEWGVIFLRQIRLWADSYPTVDFLSKILIQTPSLFPSLKHLFDPLFVPADLLAQQLKEIITPANDTPLTYQVNVGVNLLDEAKYTALTFCSENGEYFDQLTSTCLSK